MRSHCLRPLSFNILEVSPLLLLLAITAVGDPEGYFSPAIAAFRASDFTVPRVLLIIAQENWKIEEPRLENGKSARNVPA